MAIAAVVAITAVVWGVMSVRSPRVRAILYSLPIPMTLALAVGPSTGEGGQYLGVVLLVVFMYAVALLEPRLGRTWSVIASLLAYVAIGAAVHRWVALPAGVAFGTSTVALGVIWLLKRRRRTHAFEAPGRERPGALEYLAVPAVTAGTWALGSVLGPFLVTFPYSGVPTALAIRSGRVVFAESFADQAWLLLGFLGMYHSLARGLPQWAALVFAWVAFVLGTALINHKRLRLQAETGPSTDGRKRPH